MDAADAAAGDPEPERIHAVTLNPPLPSNSKERTALAANVSWKEDVQEGDVQYNLPIRFH